MKIHYALLAGLLQAGLAIWSPHPHATDSLQKLLTTAPSDSVRVLLLAQLAYEHTQTNPLATIHYGSQALQLAQQTKFRRGECLALIRLSAGFREAGNYPAALQMGLHGLRLAEDLPDSDLIGRALNSLGYLNWEQANSRPALNYFFRAKAVAEATHNTPLLTRVMGNIGNVYKQLNRLDSALLYSRQGYTLDLRYHDLTSEVGDAAMLGNIYSSLGKPRLARRYYRRSIRRALEPHITFALCRAYLGQARLFQTSAGPLADSSLYFGRLALATGQQGHYPKGILEATQFLAATYAARHDSVAAFRYLALANATRDSLFSQTRMAQVQALDVGERLRQQEQADQQAQDATARRYYWMLAALASTIPVLLLLWRTNRLKQRANLVLNSQNAKIAAQRDELSNTLAQLKTTQAQLVQSEKMAFWGEITAGIAHELQNPLAFMKNFTEISALLVKDMARDNSGASPNNHYGQLLSSLKQNLYEISQHGQRATSIITDILARSRNQGAPSVPTDLNALVTEYLCLAYQSLQAKNHSFHIPVTTALEPTLGMVPAVASDLGRVLLNLFTNAFYAVEQRQKTGEPGYVPAVSVKTHRHPNGLIQIQVHDNGTGIPEAVQTKIFAPFFTTKPASEGTGLGLALSHEIVQSHGGTLTVNSREGQYTIFTICLPA